MFAYASRPCIYMLSIIVLLATLLTSVNAKPSLRTFNDLRANSEAIQDAAQSAVRLSDCLETLLVGVPLRAVI
jgi:hypothetical protein